jgi:DNA-binding NtrC family response regulator
MPPLHLLVLARAEDRREALLSALRGAGHQPLSVPDGSGAAEAIGAGGFDALVLDLGWPELEVGRLREALAPARALEPDSLEAAERRHIALMLRYTEGNRRRAAQLLGISRSTLLHKVRKYGLDES